MDDYGSIEATVDYEDISEVGTAVRKKTIKAITWDWQGPDLVKISNELIVSSPYIHMDVYNNRLTIGPYEAEILHYDSDTDVYIIKRI